MRYVFLFWSFLLRPASASQPRSHSRIDILLPTVLDTRSNLQGTRLQPHRLIPQVVWCNLNDIEHDNERTAHNSNWSRRCNFSCLPCPAVMSSVSVSPVCCRTSIEACTWPAGMAPDHPRPMGEESDISQTAISKTKQKQTPNHMMKERDDPNRVDAVWTKDFLKRPANESTELRYILLLGRDSEYPSNIQPRPSTNKNTQTTGYGMAGVSMHLCGTCVRIHALHHKCRFLVSRYTN